MENFKQKLSWPIVDLVEGKWNSSYKLDKNAPFELKLNDNHLLIKHMKNFLKENEELKKIFNYQKQFVDELKNTNIWVKQEEQIIKMNLNDLYLSFSKFLKDSSFEDQLYNCNLVSVVGPLGPFKELTLISLLNDELVKKYVLSQVLGNKLPMRKLRIHTSGKVRIEYGQEFDHLANLEIKQITDSGILFSTNDDLLLNTIEKSQFVKFFLDTRLLNDFTNNNFKMEEDWGEEFFYTKETLRYFLIEQVNIVKSLSYKSATTNEVYLFCRYHHMLESDVPNIFFDFVNKVENHIKNLAS